MPKQDSVDETVRFNYFFSRYSITQSRIALVMGILMYMVFVVLDYWMIPDIRDIVFWLRIFVALFMSVILIYTFTHFFNPDKAQVLYTLTSLVAGLGIVFMISFTQSKGGRFYFSGIMLVVFWTFVFLGLRLKYATLSASVIIIAYNIAVIFIRHVEISVVLNDNFFIIGAGVISFSVCLTLEKQRKSIFESTNLIKKAENEALSANSAKSVFLANMSHEIRTPLNAIVGFSQILLQKAFKETLPQSYVQQLRNIKESGDLLSDLINNILDLSKIEAGKMTLEILPLNIKQLFKSIYHINKTKAQEKGLIFNYFFDENIPEIIESDRTKINQILTNLTSNALKFTPSGKTVDIRAVLENDKIVFEIADKGIGISPEMQHKVFESFEQAESSTTRLFGGTGLGLAITKKIVDLMCGEIRLESQTDVGSSFFVKIPFKISGIEVAVEDDCDFSQHRISSENIILIAEDNKMNQVMIHDFFNEIKIPIHLASDGEEVIRKAHELKPDIIFMDLHMPKIDGYQATIQLKQTDIFKNTPIVALTADVFKENKEKALQIGFSDYLTKPIDFKIMLRILEKYLKLKDEIPIHSDEIAIEQQSQIIQTPLFVKAQIDDLIKQISKIPIFSMGELVESVGKIRVLCPKSDSELTTGLNNFENALLDGNIERAEKIKIQLTDGKLNFDH